MFIGERMSRLDKLMERFEEIKAIVELCDPKIDGDVIMNMLKELYEIRAEIEGMVENNTGAFGVKSTGEAKITELKVIDGGKE